jgi:hypothetical protein
MRRTIKCAFVFFIFFGVVWPQSLGAQQEMQASGAQSESGSADKPIINLNFDPNPGAQEMPGLSETGGLGATVEREEGSYIVKLSWNASTSKNVVGYNVYRGKTSGGPYHRINTHLQKKTDFVDRRLNDDETYYYVTTAVNSEGEESEYSNQAEAAIP